MGALYIILLGDLIRALVETLFILTREAILAVFYKNWLVLFHTLKMKGLPKVKRFTN